MSKQGRGQPNILFICTDQQRADHVGFGGNDVVRTPNLDAIAARATVFDRAYVANPVCMPNRSSILTGRLPSGHGVVFNDRSLDWGANTFVRRLADAGYRTKHVGKAHIQVHMRQFFPAASDQPVGHQSRPPGWDDLESHQRYIDTDPGPVRDFYGFDQAEFCLGHGAAIGGHHRQWALQKGLDPALAGGGPQGPAAARSTDWWQVLQPAYDAGLHSTEFVTQRALDFIDAADDSEEGSPWFLFASYPDPHHPFAPPGDWYRRHAAADMVIPESFHDSVAELPKFLAQMATDAGARGPMRIDEPALKAAMAAEYGSIEMIDDGVGRLIAALERTGQVDNTIVVFTSDHGDMFGDHGFMLKGGLVFEGTTRVPLLIAAPGATGTRSSSLASSLDIGSTLLAMVGATSYDGMQGTSLLPVLANPAAVVRDHVLIEEDNPDYGLWSNAVPAHSRTIVTASARYTRYSTGESELYDHGADRSERHNRAESSAHAGLRADMTEQLVDALVAAADTARYEPVA